MKQNQLTHVRYTRSTNYGRTDQAAGEVTERQIIPTFIPKPNIKALDVSDLSETEQKRLAQLWEQYQQYYHDAIKTLFSFEDWVDHTNGDHDIRSLVKWRTFKPENLEEL